MKQKKSPPPPPLSTSPRTTSRPTRSTSGHASAPPPSPVKCITIDNPTGLPTLPLDAIHTFQGDLKKDPTPTALDKLKRSILEHRLFIAKAVFFEDGIAYTEDGHQTLRALHELKRLGYTGSEIISYEMKDGRFQESARTRHNEIMVPYQVIVPRGDTPADRSRDAAEKLLQINSQYAKINPETSFFDDLGFSLLDIDELLSKIEIPDLDIPDLSAQDDFQKEFYSYTDENCMYPIVPKFSEKYDALIIVSENETDTAFLETALQIRTEQTYKNHTDKSAAGSVGKSMVITARRFQEIWKSR